MGGVWGGFGGGLGGVVGGLGGGLGGVWGVWGVWGFGGFATNNESGLGLRSPEALATEEGSVPLFHSLELFVPHAKVKLPRTCTASTLCRLVHPKPES